ncbi:zinc transporter ZIP1 [Leptinotarsa decemlineata]|uniref:zinc transporter ZIP1 n=1 Tax=Leptinotarsa decemlineata TaxID=7539 RepID=UPI003D30D34E
MESVVTNSTIQAPPTNDLLVAKVVAMTVLGATSFLLGMLPIKLTKMISIKSVDGDKNLLISLLLCFGGGVLLFTTFIHLQPEVREGFEALKRQHLVADMPGGIPLSEIVFCLGFFFVYLVEELAHIFLDRKLHSAGLHRSLSTRRCSSKKELTIPRVTLAKFDDGNISYISTSNKDLLNSQTTVNFEKHSHDHHHVDAAIKNSFGGFLVVLALSFHAVFEGLAVGLEASVEKVWYLFAAIATHKLVIAFCVGVELVTSKTKTMLVVLYIGTFALVTPLGIGAGLILSEKSTSEDVTSIVLQGMAAGTLLYVVFFEVLARERSNRHNGFWQLVAVTAGFMCMFLLQVIIGHEHNHGGDHGGADEDHLNSEEHPNNHQDMHFI